MEDILTVILIFGGGACIAMAFSPIGRAVADRIRGKSASAGGGDLRSEEHTSELQSQSNLVCRLLLEKKKKNKRRRDHVLRQRTPPGASRLMILSRHLHL